MQSNSVLVSSGFQYYYSIKDISVGGMCICYGHAQSCPWDPVTKVTDNKHHPTVCVVSVGQWRLSGTHFLSSLFLPLCCLLCASHSVLSCVSQKLQCVCEHNTCGESCNECCPGYHQEPWQPGTLSDGNTCESKTIDNIANMTHKTKQTFICNRSRPS